MSEPDIFISYSRDERPTARRFAEAFAGEGFDVWWDAALRSGQTFDEVIESNLRAAKAVVVLWSPRSVASRWVRAEATLADRANKLVPVIIQPCTLPIIFELTQGSDLSDWTGDTTDVRWQTLVSDLRGLVGDDDRISGLAAAAEAALNAKAVEVEVPPAEDELIASLDRLSKAQESVLAKPTPEEAEQAEFYKRSDQFRDQEGDTVHCLLKLDGEERETRFAVTAAGVTIGRSAPSDIIVAGAGVSRAHCIVELAAGQLKVTDLNSTNGTFVDNKRVERSATLAPGSVLRVGNVSFEHEVRPRPEFPDIGDEAGLTAFGAGADPRQPRVARH